MTQLPGPIRPGQSTLKASEWNFLIDEVRRVSKQAAIEVLQADGFTANAPRERTVLIVKEPTDTDTTLLVSPVRYVATPPQQCDGQGTDVTCFYELSTETIEVYPDFGSRAADYKGDWFDAATDKLDNTASFLRMYFEAGTWRLQKQAVTETALVMPLSDTGSLFGRIISVVAIAVTDGFTLNPDGDPFDVFVWPGLRAIDYRILWEMAVPPVIRIEKHGDVWFARQLMPWLTAKPSGRPTGSCTIGPN